MTTLSASRDCWAMIKRNDYMSVRRFIQSHDDILMVLGHPHEGQKLLHRACLEGCDESVRAIIECYPQLLESQHLNLMTPLFYSVTSPNLFAYLLSQGANPLHSFRYVYRPQIGDESLHTVTCHVSIFDMFHANGSLESARILLSHHHGAFCHLSRYGFQNSFQVVRLCTLQDGSQNTVPTQLYLQSAANFGTLFLKYQINKIHEKDFNRRCLVLFKAANKTTRSALIDCRVTHEYSFFEWLVKHQHLFLLTQLIQMGAWSVHSLEECAKHWQSLDEAHQRSYINTLANTIYFMVMLNGDLNQSFIQHFSQVANHQGTNSLFYDAIKLKYQSLFREKTPEQLSTDWAEIVDNAHRQPGILTMARTHMRRAIDSAKPSAKVQESTADRLALIKIELP